MAYVSNFIIFDRSPLGSMYEKHLFNIYIYIACLHHTMDLFSSLLLIQGPSEEQSLTLVHYTILLTAEITRDSTSYLAAKP